MYVEVTYWCKHSGYWNIVQHSELSPCLFANRLASTVAPRVLQIFDILTLWLVNNALKDKFIASIIAAKTLRPVILCSYLHISSLVIQSKYVCHNINFIVSTMMWRIANMLNRLVAISADIIHIQDFKMVYSGLLYTMHVWLVFFLMLTHLLALTYTFILLIVWSNFNLNIVNAMQLIYLFLFAIHRLVP